MKRMEEKSRRWLRKIYQILGVTAISLLFQACYGMPMDGFCEGKCTCCGETCEDNCYCYPGTSKGDDESEEL